MSYITAIANYYLSFPFFVYFVLSISKKGEEKKGNGIQTDRVYALNIQEKKEKRTSQ
jgi:hypothetical protein